mmetsp:Transcript_7213/g.15721  ORF Transcript_7213/g.15721 Transcript_7213/m.15721 type:complete len:169 (+) Transcript_7213:1-507(+)
MEQLVSPGWALCPSKCERKANSLGAGQLLLQPLRVEECCYKAMLSITQGATQPRHLADMGSGVMIWRRVSSSAPPMKDVRRLTTSASTMGPPQVPSIQGRNLQALLFTLVTRPQPEGPFLAALPDSRSEPPSNSGSGQTSSFSAGRDVKLFLPWDAPTSPSGGLSGSG